MPNAINEHHVKIFSKIIPSIIMEQDKGVFPKDILKAVQDLPKSDQDQLVTLLALTKQWSFASFLIQNGAKPAPLTDPTWQWMWISRCHLKDQKIDQKFKKEFKELINQKELGPVFLSMASLFNHSSDEVLRFYAYRLEGVWANYRQPNPPDQNWRQWMKEFSEFEHKDKFQSLWGWDQTLSLAPSAIKRYSGKKISGSPVSTFVHSSQWAYTSMPCILTTPPHEFIKNRARIEALKTPPPNQLPDPFKLLKNHHSQSLQDYLCALVTAKKINLGQMNNLFWLYIDQSNKIVDQWGHGLVPRHVSNKTWGHSSIGKEMADLDDARFMSSSDVAVDKNDFSPDQLRHHPDVKNLTPKECEDHAAGVWFDTFSQGRFRGDFLVTFLNAQTKKPDRISPVDAIDRYLALGFCPPPSDHASPLPWRKTKWIEALAAAQSKTPSEKIIAKQWINHLGQYFSPYAVAPITQNTLWHEIFIQGYNVNDLMRSLWSLDGFDEKFKPLINHQNDQGDTVLHLAARTLNIPVIEKALALGADPSIKNDAGQTPLTAIRSFGAKTRQKIDQVTKILGQSSQQAQSPDDLLFLGCQTLAPDLVKEAIELGADVKNSKKPPLVQALKHFQLFDQSQSTALDQTTITRQLQVIDQLLDAGADIHAKDRLGNTALHYATAKGFVFIARKLLDLGADPFIQNKKGEKPYHLRSEFRAKDSGGQRAVDLVYEYLKRGMDLDDASHPNIHLLDPEFARWLKPFAHLRMDRDVGKLIDAWSDKIKLTQVIDELGLDQEPSSPTPSAKKKKM